jgi:WD40 repeat protein
MTYCPSSESVELLLGGKLPEGQAAGVREHLAGCGQCQILVDRLIEKPQWKRWAAECWPQRVNAEGSHPRLSMEPALARLLEKMHATPPPAAVGAADTAEGLGTSLAFLGPAAHEGDLGTLGRFRVLAELGRGGMGIVLLAYDQELQRTVALKVLHADRADEMARARFVREARAAAGIVHDNVVPVYAVASGPDGSPYLVMQYVEGPTLRQRIKAEGRLNPHEAARICAQAAEGLAAAHQTGLVHRDIKPANIILDPAQGRAKIMDFGLARATALPAEITQAGTVLGTPEYMSPEQVLEPDRVDGRTDVYSLGATLYEALTGEVPFRGLTHLVLQQVVSDDPRPPRRLNDTIPRDLETICLHCLQKEAGKRYASAAALAEDLRRFLAAEPIQARPVRAWERIVKWARRRPAAAALVAVSSLASLLLVTGLVVGILLLADKQRQTETALDDKGQAYGREKQAREEIDSAYQRERRASYFNGIALAEREISAHNWGRAEELLDQCEEHRRRWEWCFLKRLCHAEPVTLPLRERSTMGEGYDLAFSPDSRLLAVPNGDETIKIWDVFTGQELFVLRGHSQRVLCVAFSPDGRRLASTSEDKTVKIWDIDPRRPRGVNHPALPLGGHNDRVMGVVFSPDGQYLASASADESVKVWDSTTGQLLHDLPGQSRSNLYVAMAFSPNSRWLAFGSGDDAVKVCDLTTGQEIFTLLGHSQQVFRVAFTPDGRRLVSAARDRLVRLWDLKPNEPGVLTPRFTLGEHSMGVWSVAFSPDGQRLAVGGGRSDAVVRLYDVETGQIVFRFQGHIERVVSVAFSPDGRRLVSAGLDKNVRLWDSETGYEVLTLRGHTDLVGRVLFSPDGQRVASASADGTAQIWDAAPLDANSDPRIRTFPGHAGVVRDVVFSPDGLSLASASADHTVKIWDAAAGREIRTLRGHTNAVFSVVFSPDGRQLLSGGNDRTARLWDAHTGEKVFTLSEFSEVVHTVAFRPDGKAMATGSMQNVQLWDPRTGHALVPPLRDEAFYVACVRFSPDGKFLATAGIHLSVCIRDGTTGKVIRHFEGHRTRVFAVAFSPDGQLLASGDGDSQVKIWDAATAHEECTLSGHTGYVVGIAFSPDGRYLATASWGEIIVWDARNRTKLKMLRGLAETRSVAFSPDSKRLAASGGYRGQGKIKIWEASFWEK